MCMWLLMYLCGGNEPTKDIIREKKNRVNGDNTRIHMVRSQRSLLQEEKERASRRQRHEKGRLGWRKELEQIIFTHMYQDVMMKPRVSIKIN